MVAFDLETTGVDPTDARIVTVCVAQVQAGSEPIVETWLVDPGVEIPAEATDVHGITTEYAREHGEPVAPVIDLVADQLASSWRDGIPTIVMNAAYDLTLLDAELYRHGLASLHERLDGTPMLIMDPLVCDRALDRYRKGKKRLEDLCRVYGVTNQAAHDASGDALAAARVAWVMAERFPNDLQGDLVELQTKQSRWHFEWAEHFETYMRANVDPACVIDRAWPIRGQHACDRSPQSGGGTT